MCSWVSETAKLCGTAGSGVKQKPNCWKPCQHFWPTRYEQFVWCAQHFQPQPFLPTECGTSDFILCLSQHNYFLMQIEPHGKQPVITAQHPFLPSEMSVIISGNPDVATAEAWNHENWWEKFYLFFPQMSLTWRTLAALAEGFTVHGVEQHRRHQQISKWLVMKWKWCVCYVFGALSLFSSAKKVRNQSEVCDWHLSRDFGFGKRSSQLNSWFSLSWQ